MERRHFLKIYENRQDLIRMGKIDPKVVENLLCSW